MDPSLTSLIVRALALWASCTPKDQRVKTKIIGLVAFCQLASQSINKAAGPLALARPMVLSTGDGVIDVDAEAARNGSTWERAN